MWTPISCSLMFVMFHNTRRSRPKSFHWKDCLFLQNCMFSATSWVLKKWSYNFNINCQVTLWTLKSCSLTFVMFYITRRKGPKSFLHWKDCLFLQKFIFSATSSFLKKWSYNFNSKCQNTFWPFTICPFRFITLDDARKNRQKSFLHWKICLFFQKLVFSATS